MDEARHLDVFRKRALANGIGLLKAGPGAVGLLTAQDFTEMASTLHLVGEGFVQSMFRMGEMFAQTEVDKRMFRLAAQDESRHVAFGVMHMKYVMETRARSGATRSTPTSTAWRVSSAPARRRRD